jgi:glycosyltransferase involved in cell wall biosynthesis
MPAYNGERFIGDSIRCILEQSMQSLRLIISDNASTDMTEEICRSLATEDSRITYIRHPENLGATANYNFLARQANTEYFKWHSCNDLLSNDAIEKCVQLLDSHPDVTLVFPATYCFDQTVDGAPLYGKDPVADQERALERFFHTIDSMALNNMMNGVVRLDALRKTSMLREFYFADRTLVAELALQGKLIEDGRCSFYRRMDESSATQKKSEVEVLKHFDPSWKRPLAFTNWRVFASFMSSLWSSDVGLGKACKGTLMIGRRVWWQKTVLGRDITEYVRFLKDDLKRWAKK